MMGGDIIEKHLCASSVHKLNPLFRLVRVYSVPSLIIMIINIENNNNNNNNNKNDNNHSISVLTFEVENCMTDSSIRANNYDCRQVKVLK